MISLEWIRVKAFRSFVEETLFTLPISGLILINGRNLQTNDASGTGKSTVFYATAFALNILPSGINSGGLQSFLTKNKMQVNVGLNDTTLGKIEVGRGKETFIEYSGQRYEGANLVNEHIEKVFGLTSQMLFTMAFRPQSSSGLFLSMNDTEKKEFLCSLLGLDLIEAVVDGADKKAKELTKELVSIDAQIKAKEEVLAQIVLEDVTELEKESRAAMIEISDYQSEIERHEAELEIATAQHQADNAAIDTKYASLKLQAKTHIKNLQIVDLDVKAIIDNENKLHDSTIAFINKSLGELKANIKKLPKVEAEIKQLESNQCPTCTREWIVSEEVLRAKKLEREECLISVGVEKDFNQKLIDVTAKLKTHVVDPRIAQFQEALGTLDAKANAERRALPIGGGTGNMNMIQQHQRKIAALTAIVSTNNVKVGKQKELAMLSGSISKEIGLLKNQRLDRATRLQQEEDFSKALGKEGFLGGIFDEVLAEIVQEINNKLCSVANMSTVTFDFKTENLTSKGVVKKSIVPMVTILGHENKISALSGGMLSSLELITDLAVKDVIERRTGKQIGFYFIDEAFNGIGKPSVEACLDILKQSANTRAFYLIDHYSETKEHFSQIIEIEMENGVSRLK